MPSKNNIGGEEEAPQEGDAKPAAVSGRKEKSVLQAKLTKLAIQIGYAGQTLNFSTVYQSMWQFLTHFARFAV